MFSHRPVLLEECIQALNIRPDGIYLDGTLGRAGHSREIARRLEGAGRLICVDRDQAALDAARRRFAFEELRLLPNAHYRVRVDRTLVKNAMWAQLDEQLLEFELATEDERCVVVGAGSLPPLTNTLSLCRYESLSERVSCACSYVLY